MNKRYIIFLSASAVILLLFVARMAMLAGALGRNYRSESSRISEKKGEISAIRGRIFDEKEEVLVWSERCYDLTLDARNMDEQRYRVIRKAYRKLFAGDNVPELQTGVLQVIKYNLTADELARADELSSCCSEFNVELRWERFHKEFSNEIGEVRQINGMESGISGLEKEYDHLLRGQPGQFTVMLDRHGKWINQTFRIVTPPVAGKDIYLSDEDGAENL